MERERERERDRPQSRLGETDGNAVRQTDTDRRAAKGCSNLDVQDKQVLGAGEANRRTDRQTDNETHKPETKQMG